jgi:single-strand DNA-binding protein
MSRGLNKVMIIGHLGKDPEMRYTPSGRPVTTFCNKQVLEYG